MASMIYNLNRNGINSIGYDSYEECNSKREDKLNTLHSHFSSTRFVPLDRGK